MAPFSAIPTRFAGLSAVALQFLLGSRQNVPGSSPIHAWQTGRDSNLLRPFQPIAEPVPLFCCLPRTHPCPVVGVGVKSNEKRQNPIFIHKESPGRISQTLRSTAGCKISSVATPKNPDSKALYERELTADKTKMCVLGVAMRRLATA